MGSRWNGILVGAGYAGMRRGRNRKKDMKAGNRNEMAKG